jgi:hypothetical protein
MIDEIHVKQLMNIPLSYNEKKELFVYEKMLPLRRYDRRYDPLGFLDANQVSYYGWLFDMYRNEA